MHLPAVRHGLGRVATPVALARRCAGTSRADGYLVENPDESSSSLMRRHFAEALLHLTETLSLDLGGGVMNGESVGGAFTSLGTVRSRQSCLLGFPVA